MLNGAEAAARTRSKGSSAATYCCCLSQSKLLLASTLLGVHFPLLHTLIHMAVATYSPQEWHCLEEELRTEPRVEELRSKLCTRASWNTKDVS